MDVAAACFFLVACVSLCRFLLQEPPPARLTQRERQDVNDARFRRYWLANRRRHRFYTF
jgi:hypothetical protein